MNMIEPRVLILGSRFDFTCDYVVSALRRLRVQYLRLNSEDFCRYRISLDPVLRELRIGLQEVNYFISSKTLSSVLFRRPVFLRDYGDDRRSVNEIFSEIQWAAFVQNLLIFDEARWYNSPASTYRSELKAVQLLEAARLGFSVPQTEITNYPANRPILASGKKLAVKGLDTVMVRDREYELFGFTTFADAEEIAAMEWASAPAVIQQAIRPKVDLRVTVIEDQVYAVKVLDGDQGFIDDWRLNKTLARFMPFDLPAVVRRRCTQLVASLGLRFGAIDLALSGSDYFFLEINPTGEWAWLVDATGLKIDEGLANALAS